MVAIIGRLFFVMIVCSHSLGADSLPISRRSSAQNPQRQGQPRVELALAKEEFFVGEYVPFKLRVFYDAHTYELQNMVPPTAGQLLFQDISKPKKWRDTVTDQWIAEWEGILYATKEGKFDCGPLQIIMQQRTTQAANRWSFFSTNYAVAMESNAVSCVVFSFPIAADRAIHPIGNFHDAHLECDQTHFQAGQAVALRIHVAGRGHLPPQSHTQLQLPEGLKWYPADIKKEQDGYCFEYVVQALKDDIFIVPAQKFIFFDPDLKRYRTLTTETLRLHVAPGAKKQVEKADDAFSPEMMKQQEEEQPQDDLLAVGPSMIRTFYIPDGFLFLLIILGIVGGIGYRSLYRLRAWGSLIKRKWEYRKLLRQARSNISIVTRYPLRKSEDTVRLYEVFKKLQSGVDWENQTTSVHDRWKLFWHMLECFRFSNDAVGNGFLSDDQGRLQFVTELQWWLLFFEKKAV